METQNTMLNRRAKDVNDEKIVGSYLDKYFYPLFCTDFTRNTTDINKQYTGEDIWVTTSTGERLIIDEKAATQYANKNLQTFAIEISNRNRRGDLQEGWYINPRETNNYYLFCWVVDAYTTSDNHIKEEGINSLDVALIKKEDLVNYIDGLGWTKNNLWKKQGIIRNHFEITNTLYGVCMGDMEKNKCRFHMQTKFFEQSINLLLKKDELINISTLAYTINKDYNILLHQKEEYGKE